MTTHKETLRVLLVDCDDRRDEMSDKLVETGVCECVVWRHLVSSPEALDAVKECHFRGAWASRLPIDKYKDTAVVCDSFDVVVLHAGNAYARGYFQGMTGRKVVILYSGEAKWESWFSELEENNRARACYFHLGFDEVRYFGDILCDFLFEFNPNATPPWDALNGRSSVCRKREQEFAEKLKSSGV